MITIETLEKRYGLPTAICMVIGTVIGSGVFFKGQTVLEKTGGNLTLGILAWAITGIMLILCSIQFAVMATKYEKVSGVVDYAEATCGKSYAYHLAWFMVNIYYPAMTSVLAWVSARYFGVLVGWNDPTTPQVMTLAGFLLIVSYMLNALSPKLAGKFQVSATVVKLIPLTLMAIVGTTVGTVSGTLPRNFAAASEVLTGGGAMSSLFAAIVATAFAYEGWIVATSINTELKNAKRNLPIALALGAVVVVSIYVLYFVGLAGGADTAVLIKEGAPTAFTNLFGTVGGILLNICIVVSCLGTLNGLMLATTRGMYAIASRDEGPKREMFRQIDPASKMVTNSAIWGLFVCSAWLLYFYGANLTDTWFGPFTFDSSELPVITIYAMYVPMMIKWMMNEKELGVFKRFVTPALALIACLFMVFAAIYSHGITPYLEAAKVGKFSCPALFYLVIFAVIMLIGTAVRNPRKQPR